MIQTIVEAMPVWKRVAAYLSADESVLLRSPRYHRVQSVLDGVRRFYGWQRPVHCITLGCALNHAGTTVDFEELWAVTREGVPGTTKCSVTDVHSYKAAVRKLLQRCTVRVLVVVETSEHRLGPEHGALLETFNDLLREFSHVGKLQVVATDDYALLPPSPPVEFFQKVHFGHVDLEVVAWCIDHISGIKKWNLKETDLLELSRGLHAETGGHPGLVWAGLEKLEQDGLEAGMDATLETVRVHLEADDIIDRIAKALGSDAKNYCRTALKFEKPERTSPADHISAFLKQLGVLRRHPLGRLELYPGLITRLVKDMASGLA